MGKMIELVEDLDKGDLPVKPPFFQAADQMVVFPGKEAEPLVNREGVQLLLDAGADEPESVEIEPTGENHRHIVLPGQCKQFKDPFPDIAAATAVFAIQLAQGAVFQKGLLQDNGAARFSLRGMKQSGTGIDPDGVEPPFFEFNKTPFQVVEYIPFLHPVEIIPEPKRDGQPLRQVGGNAIIIAHVKAVAPYSCSWTPVPFRRCAGIDGCRYP